MSLIHVRNAGVFSPRVLFQNLDFTVHATDRIGLIAGNGAGKTTLLRLLAGRADADAGDVTRRRGLVVGFVEQDVPESMLDLPLTEAIRRGLPVAEREAAGWKVGLVLDLLETPEALRAQPLRALSGGWQRLALIARQWVRDPDVLLLDEPTNHLDSQRLAVLERWINHATEGVGMVIASHDRQFLDACTNRSLFLRAEASRMYGHAYSQARMLLEAADGAQERKATRDTKAAERLRRSAGQLRNVGVNSGSDLLLKKSKQLNERAVAIEETLRPVERQRAGTIVLNARDSRAKVLVSLQDLTVVSPSGVALFHCPKLMIFRGDRVVLRGANGAGKSQFVRLLDRVSRAEGAHAGIRFAADVQAGYLDQQMAHLPPAESPLAWMTEQFRLGDQRSRSVLAGAGFDIETQRRPIAQLSLGQKSRLGLLALRLAVPNLYLMDEPTNHIDIAGQERLEQEIIASGATCVLVSHDRAFVRAIGTRFLEIENGRLREVAKIGAS
jgi:ATPase subunit of ABC transporter with duplicated ATPase domains